MEKKTLMIGLAGGAIMAGLAVLALFGIAAIFAYFYFNLGSGWPPQAATHPSELGVQANESDLNSSKAELEAFKNGSTNGTLVLTEEQFTALVAENAKGMLDSPQFKFNADGTFEATGKLNGSYYHMPLYLRGNVVLVSARELGIDITTATIGGVGVPGAQVEDIEKMAKGASDDYFSKNPKARVESLAVEEGKLVLKGSLN